MCVRLFCNKGQLLGYMVHTGQHRDAIGAGRIEEQKDRLTNDHLAFIR